MGRNKFYLLVAPLLVLVATPFWLVWRGLESVPELLEEYGAMPSELARAWRNATWFPRRKRSSDRPHLQPIELYGDHMTCKDWMAGVKSGCFTDYDGHGYWATATHRSNVMVIPSDVTASKKAPPVWATHVLWFNK